MKTPQTIERFVSSHDLIEMLPINSHISCVRITSIHTQDETVIRKTVQEGFSETAAIKNWPGNTTAPFNGQIFLSAPGFAENFRLWGMPQHALKDKGWGDKSWENGISKTPYTDILDNPLRAADVLRFNGYDHTMTRMDGSIVPKPIVFNYSEAQMHEGEFNLEQVADIISSRNDIAILIEASYSKIRFVETPLAKDEDFKGVIQSVRSYGDDNESKECINFIWRPSEEVFQAMQKAIGPKGGGYEQFKYINDNDLLGINIARKQKVEEIAVSVKRKNYR